MASDSVRVDITVQNLGTPQAGFGIVLIPSHTATFPEAIKAYAEESEAEDDFPDEGSAERRALRALFSQNPRPQQVLIGKTALAATPRYRIGISDVKNSATYGIEIASDAYEPSADVEYAADGTATKAEIAAGLLAAINAVDDKNFTAGYAAKVFADLVFTANAGTDELTAAAHGLTTGDGPVRGTNSGGALPAGLALATDYWAIRVDDNTFKLATSLPNAIAGTAIDITTAGTGVHTLIDQPGTLSPETGIDIVADAPGNYFAPDLVSFDALKWLTLEETTALPAGLSDALASFKDEDETWYAIHTLINSQDYIEAVATWAQANQKQYFFATPDTEVAKTAYSEGVTDDVGSDLLASGPSYVNGLFHPRPSEQLAAALMGRWLPTAPGSAIPKFKTLEGPTFVKLTTTWKNNIKARRMGAYVREFQRNFINSSMSFSSIYLYADVRRNVDWLKARCEERIFGVLAGADIIPYTPAGVAQLEGAVRPFLLTEAVEANVLAPGTVKIQPVIFTNIPVPDKAGRNFRALKWSGILAGAVEEVIPASGTVYF